MKLTAALLLTVVSLPAAAVAQTPAQYDSIIDAAYKADEPGGVALVARHGQVLYERAFGLANVELRVPMRTNSVFCIASMTKQFTAVAVLQPVERGLLALDDTVGRILPDFPAPLNGITSAQLFAHTAGVPNAREITSLLAARGWLSADQVVKTFKDLPLDFAPGTRWSYSNSGYQLLGYIVEKVTGQPLPGIPRNDVAAARWHDRFVLGR